MQTVGFEPTTREGQILILLLQPLSHAYQLSDGLPTEVSLIFNPQFAKALIALGKQLTQSIQMQGENYEKIKVLGEGTYGKCYLVRHRSTDEILVLKQIEIMGMAQSEIDEAVREAQILQSLDHPFIVSFKGSFQTKEGYLNILMSYADGGDLSERIKQARERDEPLTESTILDWFTQVCLAIKHVHKQKIIHRDIKSQNVFLTKEGKVKLGDFGIARPLQLTLQKIKSVVGTPYYMSPEICENKEYSLKTDIWSLGVLLLEMCLRRQPFDAQSLPALALKIAKGEYTPIPKVYSRELKKLVSDMMQVEPSKRPNIDQILKSPLTNHRADQFLPREIRERQFCSHTPNELNMNKAILGAASRGLFIKCAVEEAGNQPVYSPKNYMPGKNMDMPVKRIDNYTKEVTKDKKAPKKSQLRKREASEPTLTPKGHAKIQNERKVIAKNSSVVSFQKKSAAQPGLFKKKSKQNVDIVGLREINEVQGVKNEIKQMLISQLSQAKEIEEVEIEEFQETTRDNQQKPQEGGSETALQTLESLILTYQGVSDLSELYRECGKEGGIYRQGKCPGLVTMAFQMRQEQCGF